MTKIYSTEKKVKAKHEKWSKVKVVLIIRVLHHFFMFIKLRIKLITSKKKKCVSSSRGIFFSAENSTEKFFNFFPSKILCIIPHFPSTNDFFQTFFPFIGTFEILNISKFNPLVMSSIFYPLWSVLNLSTMDSKCVNNIHCYAKN